MKDLIRSVLTLVLCISVGFAAFAQDAPKKKVAVYMTGDKVDDTYKKVIGSKLVTAITESGEYAAVERTSDFLAAISAENDYQTSGEVRDNQIAALGQKFGVKYVVVADVSEVFDEFFIAARIINVESGLVDRACDVNGPAESMAQLIELSKQVAQQLMLETPQPVAVKGSTTPKHLSLCVKDRTTGKISYITTKEWEALSADEKNQYIKKGICIIGENRSFLLADLKGEELTFRDADSRRGGRLPSAEEAKTMKDNADELNAALREFGGSPFIGVIGFWTNEIRRKNDESGIDCLIYHLYSSPIWLDRGFLEKVNYKAECRLVSNIPRND
ncbi:MAG: hypothetical protein NC241_01095 [Bacteroides sp.]|nr:hypothetical protein [Bacteroides sp.]MCM1457297.1 hypothetical protein [Lachnoclostridium sp.]